MSIAVLKAEFDLLWVKVTDEQAEDEFLKFLESDYELYDFERVRDLTAQENPEL